MNVLITGAAGGVARMLLPGIEGRYRLTLTDRYDSELTGDLADPEFAAEVTRGVEAVVHLAGHGNPSATWRDLADSNAAAVAVLLEAARSNGVRRVVLAGSVHAMGGYAGRPLIDPAWPPLPCCLYGATKVFAEAAAFAAHRRFGQSVICLRLGGIWPAPPALDALGHWLAPADLQQLVRRAIEADAGFGVYHGVSANTRSRWDISNAVAQLGYRPSEDSERHLDEVALADGWDTCPAV